MSPPQRPDAVVERTTVPALDEVMSAIRSLSMNPSKPGAQEWADLATKLRAAAEDCDRRALDPNCPAHASQCRTRSTGEFTAGCPACEYIREQWQP